MVKNPHYPHARVRELGRIDVTTRGRLAPTWVNARPYSTL